MKAIANPQQGSISTTLDFALMYTVTNTSNTIVKTWEEPGRTVTLVNCDKGQESYQRIQLCYTSCFPSYCNTSVHCSKSLQLHSVCSHKDFMQRKTLIFIPLANYDAEEILKVCFAGQVQHSLSTWHTLSPSYLIWVPSEQLRAFQVQPEGETHSASSVNS